MTQRHVRYRCLTICVPALLALLLTGLGCDSTSGSGGEETRKDGVKSSSVTQPGIEKLSASEQNAPTFRRQAVAGYGVVAEGEPQPTPRESIKVALPTASEARSLGDQSEIDKAVTLDITEKGELLFNKEPIALEQLPMKLQTYKVGAKDPRVIVNGDAKTPWSATVNVIDEVRKAGISKVAINTTRK